MVVLIQHVDWGSLHAGRSATGEVSVVRLFFS